MDKRLKLSVCPVWFGPSGGEESDRRGLPRRDMDPATPDRSLLGAWVGHRFPICLMTEIMPHEPATVRRAPCATCGRLRALAHARARSTRAPHAPTRRPARSDVVTHAVASPIPDGVMWVRAVPMPAPSPSPRWRGQRGRARHGLYGPGGSIGADEFGELIVSAFRMLRDSCATLDFLRNLRTVNQQAGRVHVGVATGAGRFAQPSAGAR